MCSCVNTTVPVWNSFKKSWTSSWIKLDPPSRNLCVSPPKIYPVVGGHTRITPVRHTDTETGCSQEETMRENASVFHWRQLSPARLFLLGLLMSLNGRVIVIFSLQVWWCTLQYTVSRHLGAHRRERVIGASAEQVQWKQPIRWARGGATVGDARGWMSAKTRSVWNLMLTGESLAPS